MNEKLRLQGIINDKKTAQKRHIEQLALMRGTETKILSALQDFTKYLDGRISKTEVVNQIEEISTPDIDKVVGAIENLDMKQDFKPVIDSLDQLKEELVSLPDKMPRLEAKDIDLSGFKDLEKAIKELKLPTPQVNIEPSKPVDLSKLEVSISDVTKAVKGLKLPETDLSEVEKKLEKSNKLLKEIVDKPTGGGGGGGNGTPYTDTTGKPLNVVLDNGAIPTSDVPLATRIDDQTPILYVGKAPVGSATSAAVWQIHKIDETSGVSITYADGNANFDNVFDNRAALTYS